VFDIYFLRSLIFIFFFAVIIFSSERGWSYWEVVHVGAVWERGLAEYHSSPTVELEFWCRHSEQDDQSWNAAASCRHSGYVVYKFFTYCFISLVDVKNGSDEIFSCAS